MQGPLGSIERLFFKRLPHLERWFNMLNIDSWSKVVTSPLGLSAFVLYIVYLALCKAIKKGIGKQDVFIGLFALVVVWCLLLIWRQTNPVSNVQFPQSQEKVDIKGDNNITLVNKNGNVKMGNIIQGNYSQARKKN